MWVHSESVVERISAVDDRDFERVRAEALRADTVYVSPICDSRVNEITSPSLPGTKNGHHTLRRITGDVGSLLVVPLPPLKRPNRKWNGTDPSPPKLFHLPGTIIVINSAFSASGKQLSMT